MRNRPPVRAPSALLETVSVGVFCCAMAAIIYQNIIAMRSELDEQRQINQQLVEQLTEQRDQLTNQRDQLAEQREQYSEQRKQLAHLHAQVRRLSGTDGSGSGHASQQGRRLQSDSASNLGFVWINSTPATLKLGVGDGAASVSHSKAHNLELTAQNVQVQGDLNVTGILESQTLTRMEEWISRISKGFQCPEGNYWSLISSQCTPCGNCSKPGKMLVDCGGYKGMIGNSAYAPHLVDITSNGTCVACTYYLDTNKGVSQRVPDHAHSVASSGNMYSQRCPWACDYNYILWENKTGCKMGCPAGEYYDSGSGGVCMGCPAGRYGDKIGLTSAEECTACPAGMYGGVGQTDDSGCTASPTAYPTPFPTPFPTPYPTPYPTPFPTPFPTPYPTPYPTRHPTSFPAPIGRSIPITNYQDYNGYRYAVMDNAPKLESGSECQWEYIAMPAGWSLVPYSDGIARNVVNMAGTDDYLWRTSCLVFSNGASYTTWGHLQNCDSVAGQSYLDTSGDSYRVTKCSRKVLIRRPR